MPKKFANENPKVIAARERKAAAKKDEETKKQKALEDAYWADNDKLVNRKLQRRDEEERKRAEILKRKEEIRRLAEEEMNGLASKSPNAQPQKVTRATIEQRRDAELRLQLEEDKRLKLAVEKIEVVDHLEENLNQLELDKECARTVSDAIRILGGDREEIDNHPEKRMRAAYLAFEETRLPRLKQEHPTYRLSQLKQLLKKEWQKSPENPINAKLMALAAK
uniref:HMG box domain-containing protein n=1 Tax=Angiostrongylus cantonensis TaxID=6313 RepID=A0A0K0D1Z6_ANGCA